MKEEQIEMLLHRVCSAESALRTIVNHTWDREQTLVIARRALKFCDGKTEEFICKYPDTGMAVSS